MVKDQTFYRFFSSSNLPLWNKIPHGWFIAFWDGMGGGNHHTKFQNRLLQDISSGRKWGEFPRFWEVLCFDMCFQISVLVIGSAVSEISQFARFSIWLQNIWRCVPAFPRCTSSVYILYVFRCNSIS